MTEYKVFNDKNVAVKVTDEDLDRAAAEEGPVPTHIANAAAIAKRREFAPRLQRTLLVDGRTQKLIAAHTLLALGDASAIPALDEAAAASTDPIVASMFRAVSLRLVGPEDAKGYFSSPDGDPKVKSMLIAIYSSHLELEEGDIRFFIAALRAFMEKHEPWIAAMDRELWATRIDIIVTRLAGPRAKALLGSPSLREQRGELLECLDQIGALPLGRETKRTAKKVVSQLSAVPD